MLILVLIVIIVVIILFRYINFTNENNVSSKIETTEKLYDFKGKVKESLLTNNEVTFYNKLKRITNNYNLNIFTKIRLADIFQSEDYANFNKIKSKHIDFVICDNDTKPILFIELDDSTHNYKKNMENDEKKNIIFQSCNLKLIRVKLNEAHNKLIEIENEINSK